MLPKVCGTLCMFMHVGFSMVETGSCRARNASDLLIKNVLSLGSIGDSKLDVQRCAKGKLPRHLFSGFCHFVHVALHFVQGVYAWPLWHGGALDGALLLAKLQMDS